MPDVFTRLVGQDRAVHALRNFARQPVHAYLFNGPAGSSLRDAVVAFAAALQCSRHGCGQCEACRLVLTGHDPDVYVAERAGVSWRIDELREAERVSRRRPLSGPHQIIVLENVELTTTGSSPSAAALLKSLEEPPPRTVFLLTAEELPEALHTIASRCVEVALRGLGESDLEAILTGEGASPQSARTAAAAAGGNLRRARVLVRDDALVDRIAQWRSVPERLVGTPAAAAQVADAISHALDRAMAPLALLQEEELARRVQDAREMGQRSVANRKEIESQYKREQRRFRIDELRFGLTALTNVYRERLRDDLADVEPDDRSSRRVAASLRAIDSLGESARRLPLNIDEGLLLHDLMLSLTDL